MLRAVIADDDEGMLRILRANLEATGKVTIVGEARDGEACLQLIEETAPDVVFLDIAMPKVDGIEVAEGALHSECAPLIAFISGYPEYAIKAFELDAVDFVLKPYKPDRIREVVHRMERDLSRREDSLAALRKAIVDLALREPPGMRKIAVKDPEAGSLRLLDPRLIVYVERQKKKIVLFTQENEFSTTGTIERMEARLSGEGFVRVNSGTLVNLEYISHLQPRGDGSYDLILKDDCRTRLSVSRARARLLLSMLKP